MGTIDCTINCFARYDIDRIPRGKLNGMTSIMRSKLNVMTWGKPSQPRVGFLCIREPWCERKKTGTIDFATKLLRSV